MRVVHEIGFSASGGAGASGDLIELTLVTQHPNRDTTDVVHLEGVKEDLKRFLETGLTLLENVGV